MLHAAGSVDEGALLLERVVEVRERMLGPENQGTLLAVSNLAVLREAQGRPEEAATLYRRAIDGSLARLVPKTRSR
jgi:hypothetical protein